MRGAEQYEKTNGWMITPPTTTSLRASSNRPRSPHSSSHAAISRQTGLITCDQTNSPFLKPSTGASAAPPAMRSTSSGRDQCRWLPYGALSRGKTDSNQWPVSHSRSTRASRR